MNQEFIIGPFKIIQDEEGFGVAELVQTKVEGCKEPVKGWEIVATFKFGMDALLYYTSRINEHMAMVNRMMGEQNTEQITENIIVEKDK